MNDTSVSDPTLETRILDDAAPLLAAHGYYATSLEQIASEAGISTTEILTIFPDRYEIFARVALRATSRPLEASRRVALIADDARSARATLESLIAAIAHATIAQRDSSGFYRSEVRHLTPEHRALNSDTIHQINERIRQPLAVMRPELSPDEVRILSAAAISSITSITIHPTPFPEAKIFTLLTTAAMRVLDSAPATTADTIEGPHFTLPWADDHSIRNRTIVSTLTLTAQRGIETLTIDAVAAHAGATPAEVAAEYPHPLDALVDGCTIGGLEFEEANRQSLAATTSARTALTHLCHNYVRYSFEEPDGITSFLNDGRRLPGEYGDRLLSLQTTFITHWVTTLLTARPELSVPEARFLTFAGLSIVSDIGRLLQWQREPLTEARIEHAVLAALAVTPSS